MAAYDGSHEKFNTTAYIFLSRVVAQDTV